MKMRISKAKPGAVDASRVEACEPPTNVRENRDTVPPRACAVCEVGAPEIECREGVGAAGQVPRHRHPQLRPAQPQLPLPAGADGGVLGAAVEGPERRGRLQRVRNGRPARITYQVLSVRSKQRTYEIEDET